MMRILPGDSVEIGWARLDWGGSRFVIQCPGCDAEHVIVVPPGTYSNVPVVMRFPCGIQFRTEFTGRPFARGEFIGAPIEGELVIEAALA